MYVVTLFHNMRQSLGNGAKICHFINMCFTNAIGSVQVYMNETSFKVLSYKNCNR
jgi:hypothetical protein